MMMHLCAAKQLSGWFCTGGLAGPGFELCEGRGRRGTEDGCRQDGEGLWDSALGRSC